jgi:ribonucleotide monophosphatase NagD (HAD superfamily)
MKVIPSDLTFNDHMSSVAAGLMDAVDDELDDAASPQLAHPAKIAYVGDHIHGDVLASKSFGWHAIAIVGGQCG